MSGYGIFDLTGRTALVTGASRGLGRAFAEAMAMYGADVACVGRDTAKLAETVKILKKYKHKAIAIKADMNEESQIKKMVAETVKEFGRIDICFNNAGVAKPPLPIHKTPTAEWEAVIQTDLRGVFLCLKHEIPVMIKQKKGSIINIASIAGLRAEVPEVAPPAYGAAKAGVIVLTSIAAIQYAKYNIRVNCIAPGLHKSDLGHKDPHGKRTAEDFKEVERRYCAQEIPMARIAEPGELHGLAVLLASDASSYITGQVFIQDGGQSARI